MKGTTNSSSEVRSIGVLSDKLIGESSYEKAVFLRNFIILLAVALLTVIFVNRTGAYPWGSDTYGHLYKGNILYDSMKNGNLFLNYSKGWYNGIQPYRYWAPLPYYVLALINLETNNIFITYNFFILFSFVLGGLGWLLWGNYTNRQNLSLLFALLWFFIPNNLRILFSEGNIPYVVVNNLVPYVFLFYYKSLNSIRLRNFISLSAAMMIVTLSHAMLSAMLGVALFMLGFLDSIVNKNFKKNFISLIFSFLGIMTASFWLYPALKGGIMSIDKSAVSDVMKDLAYPILTSLNPMLRFSNIEVYYFGLAFAITALFGLFFSTKRERAPFLTALLILIGTTKFALPLLQKLPMNQLFWMSRFTSIAMALIIMAVLLWKSLRNVILGFVISILIIDSSASFYVLGFNGQYPKELSNTIDVAAKMAVQRVGILDDSEFGSFPSFYLGYNPSKEADGVFGWAWQGASTSKNIVMLNTSLEKGYYGFMFDRALELGADTLLIKKDLIKDIIALRDAASKEGYIEEFNSSDGIIFKFPSEGSFGTSVKYKGIAIGSYSPNIIYLFPSLKQGNSNYLDDYSFDELKNEKLIYLSGFRYRSKNKAEELLVRLSRNGTRIVIDSAGLEEKFLGVNFEPITLKDNYKDIYYNGQILQLNNFPKDMTSWNTNFLSGLDNKKGYEIVDHRLVDFTGTKDNENLNFISLNIPYYAFLTKDSNAIRILEDEFKLKAYEIPRRNIEPINISYSNNMISIKSKTKDVIVPIAALDAFAKVKGNYAVNDQLINIKTPEVQIKIIYPYMVEGVVISLISCILIFILSIAVKLNKGYFS